MKRNIKIGSVVGGLSILIIGFYFLFTVPMIEKRNLSSIEGSGFVGGETSHSNVMYRDYRPILENKKLSTPVWFGMGNEFRRLEVWQNNGYTYTVVVLRDETYPYSWIGVTRSSHRFKTYQGEFDGIVSDYNSQSIFDRAWLWQVR